jgi:ornithine cyclodeaminase/alanine dehydrogenase
MTAVASGTAEDAISDADIVVTSVTLSYELEPFLDARWLKPGAFVSSTDLALPWIPEGMAAFDRIVIDDLEQESTMPTPMVDPRLVTGDLTNLVTGAAANRDTDAQRTAFVFRGMAVGDLALAALGYQRARQNSQGVPIKI